MPDEIFKRLQEHLPAGYKLISSHIDTKAYLRPASGQAPSKAHAHPSSRATGCCQGGGGNIQDLGAEPSQEQSTCCGGTTCCNQSSASSRQPLGLDSRADQEQNKRASCRTYTLPAGTSLAHDFAILYIGPESLAMNNLLLSNANTPIFSYLPAQDLARLESGRTNRMLMRRYGVVSKARDADVYGIVVGTLGVCKAITLLLLGNASLFSYAASYLPTLAYLRKLLRKHKKKSYTMAVGKLTPAKLGNFLEVETWVLVACGENSLVEAHKEFMRPIITPWELEVALGEREWATGPSEEGEGRSKGYTLDFSDVLDEATASVGDDPAGTVLAEDTGFGEVVGDDPEGPIFSTATGQYRYRKTYGSKEDFKGGSVTLSNIHECA